MSLLGSPRQLRLWAGLLVVSLLPLAVQAPSAGPPAATQPAGWLEAQVRGLAEAASAGDYDPQNAFDRALQAAEGADARTLHGFLTAFLEAHARLTGAEAVATEGRSCQALLQHLRRRLARTGLRLGASSQMTSPPAAPQRLVRLVLGVGGPLAERIAPAGLPGGFGQCAARSFSAFLPEGGVSVVSGRLIRVLFSGRTLGP